MFQWNQIKYISGTWESIWCGASSNWEAFSLSSAEKNLWIQWSHQDDHLINILCLCGHKNSRAWIIRKALELYYQYISVDPSIHPTKQILCIQSQVFSTELPHQVVKIQTRHRPERKHAWVLSEKSFTKATNRNRARNRCLFISCIIKNSADGKNAPNLSKSPSCDDPICTRKISCLSYSYKTKMPEVWLFCNQ